MLLDDRCYRNLNAVPNRDGDLLLFSVFYQRFLSVKAQEREKRLGAIHGSCETEGSETSIVAPIASVIMKTSSSSRLGKSPTSKLITVVDRNFDKKNSSMDVNDIVLEKSD